jgi:hypothetical protein
MSAVSITSSLSCFFVFESARKSLGVILMVESAQVTASGLIGTNEQIKTGYWSIYSSKYNLNFSSITVSLIFKSVRIYFLCLIFYHSYTVLLLLDE